MRSIGPVLQLPFFCFKRNIIQVAIRVSPAVFCMNINSLHVGWRPLTLPRDLFLRIRIVGCPVFLIGNCRRVQVD